ncbi:MAG: hypothetical protein HC824_00910 [Synechococcales cyanobacterium RM1_1_8]|nr:hypothetical protein [Synechococcales cyanobacterium RM1_1_8]
MHIIEIYLKLTAMPMSVQRKEAEGAEQVYQQVMAAIQSGTPNLLELTCEHQPDKKVSILTSEISAVQVYEKSGMATGGKRPGFAFAE